MPLVFNPLDPWSWLAAASPRAVYPTQPRLSAGTPITIVPTTTDPGLCWSKAENQLTLSGRAQGPAQVDPNGWGSYELARSASFTLDIDRAPTVDVFGRRNFTEKNSRIITISTETGWSAAECARRLAEHVNGGDDFRALVSVNADGSATIAFRRR